MSADFNLADFLKPGTVGFIEVLHDDHCPTLASGNGNDCQCSPVVRLHSDADYFVKSQNLMREQRRKAEREAAKAMRKATKGGAA